MSWRRILLLTATFLAFLLAGTWVVLQETGAARTFVQSMLGRLLATDFALRDAIVDLSQGTLTLRDFMIDDPTQKGSRLAQVERLQLGIDTNPLGDVLSVHTVEIEGLDLRVDLTAGRTPALADILRRPGDSQATVPKKMPPVRVRRSRIELKFAAGKPPLRLSDVNLELLPVRGIDGKSQLSGTAQCPDLGLAFAINGSADVKRSEFQATARLDRVQVDDALLQRLHDYLPDPVPIKGISGTLTQVVLWFEHRGAAAAGEPAAGPLAGVIVHASDVACILDEVPYPVTGAAMEIAASTANGGTVQLAARQDRPSGRLEVRATVSNAASDTPRVEVRGTAKGLLIDDDALRALARLEVGRNIIAAIAPTAGSANVDLFMQRVGDQGDLELDVEVSGAAITYHGFGHRRVGFPVPLVDTRGRVSARDGIISLQGLAANIAAEAGGGEVTCEGRITDVPGEPSEVRIDVHAPRMNFTKAVRDALATLLDDQGQLHDDFSPQGQAAVTVHIRPEREGGWQVRLEPLGSSASWSRFPVRLSDLQGTILLHEEGVAFDLRGVRHGGTLETRGRLSFPADDSPHWHTELWVGGKQITIDDDLRAAALTMAPDLETVFAQFQPSGLCDVDVTVWRQAGEPQLDYDARIGLGPGDLGLTEFGLSLCNVAGNIFVHGKGREQRIDVDALHGELRDAEGAGTASVAVIGSIRRADGRRRSQDLTTVVRNLKLDGRLADSLHKLGALRRSTWDVLAPSGPVDLVLHQEMDPRDQSLHNRLRVLLRGVASDAEMLPKPARDVTGELEILDGVVTFKDIQARLESAIVFCSEGRAAPSAVDPNSTDISFTVSSERFPVDDGLARMFFGSLRQAILDRKFAGVARVSDLRLGFFVPSDESPLPFTTTIEGQVAPRDASMELGTRVEGLHGLVDIARSTFHGAEGELRGRISGGSFRLFSQPCDNVQASFVADARHLRLDDVGLRLHTGTVRGRRHPPGETQNPPPLEYRMPDPGEEIGLLSLDMEFTGINLQEMLRQGGMESPPYSGMLRGEVRLDRLRGADFVNMVGEGAVAVVDGNLGAVPLFTAIYARLRESDRPRFETASARFRIADRNVELEHIALSSPMIKLSGKGRMSMECYLDVTMTLDNLFGDSANLLVLPPLLHTLARELVRFHVFGHLRSLNAENRWLLESNPGKTRIVPLPPRMERPARRDY